MQSLAAEPFEQCRDNLLMLIAYSSLMNENYDIPFNLFQAVHLDLPLVSKTPGYARDKNILHTLVAVPDFRLFEQGV